MYVNLKNCHNLKDVINRYVLKKYNSYETKLNWSSGINTLSIHAGIYNRDIFSYKAANGNHNDGLLHRHLHYDCGDTLNYEIGYDEMVNQYYYTLSNILEGSYEIEDNEVIYNYDYDEYF